MAHVDESLLIDHEENDIKDIVKLQALFRGALVRKWISDTRQMYEDVLSELESSQKVSVHWMRDKPCYPTLKRKSSKRNKDKNMEMKTDRKELGSNVPEVSKEIRSSFSEKDSNAELKDNFDNSDRICTRVPDVSSCEKEPQFVQKISSTVETQTSFCATHKTENFSPTIHNIGINERVPTFEVEQDGNQSETTALTGGAINRQSDTPRSNVDTLPFQPETEEKDRISSLSSESHVLPQDNSTQGESFFNHTADIEHSLFRSMQNKTLNKSDTQEKVADDGVMLEKNAEFQFEGPVKDTGYSPVPKQQEKQCQEENSDKIKSSFPGRSSEDLTSVTMATSVWDSFASSKDQMNEYVSPPSEKLESASQVYPRDRESLQELRKNIAMELLWVQQAINSRKNYLRLRSQMKT